MGRRRAAAAASEPAPARRPVRPAPDTPALLDIRILVVAALVASPAAYRASQGLLTVDQALTRFLMVTLACVATAVVVRALWPLLAGPPAAGATHEAADGTGEAREESLSPPPG